MVICLAATCGFLYLVWRSPADLLVDQIKIVKARADLKFLKEAVLEYKKIHGVYPLTLEYLIQGEEPILKELPVDPFPGPDKSRVTYYYYPTIPPRDETREKVTKTAALEEFVGENADKYFYDEKNQELEVIGVMTEEERDELLKCVKTSQDKRAIIDLFQRFQGFQLYSCGPNGKNDCDIDNYLDPQRVSRSLGSGEEPQDCDDIIASNLPIKDR